ncbi:TlpA family protein disulfide reductase [Nocardioides pakistanensis]
MPSRRAVLSALAVAAVPGLAACGESSANQGQSFASGDGIIEQVPVAERGALPPITGELLPGGDYDSREMLGMVVVYNVWGSWCAPCREEAPALRKVAKQTRADGVRFIGINVRDNDASALAFERRYNIPYPSIRTADSQEALLAFGSKLPPSAVPSTMIVDREGRLAARVIGKTSYGTLSALVEDVLAEDGGRG